LKSLGGRQIVEAFLISISTIAFAEMGDRTQLLSLALSTQFRQPTD